MSYDFSNVNILLVEPTKEVSSLLKHVLEAFDVPANNIDEAHEYDTARELCKSKEYDIVIADWLDKNNGGLKLTEEIRKNDVSGNQYSPIILTSASSSYGHVHSARDAGISEYLIKPFCASTLAKTITRVIEKPKLFVLSDEYKGPDRRSQKKPITFPDRRKTPSN